MMINKFKSELDSLQLGLNTTIYLAISGGVDSMILSYLLVKNNINHTLLHCNFKLRGIESDTDEHFITEYADVNNIPIHTISFDTKAKSLELKLNTQECARKLRYDWFKTFIDEPNSILLTAHHLDDAIETFFINLLRGTGIKGISGIPSGKNKIYRPLLNFTKEEITEFAKSNKINFRADSSNDSDDYLRNKLRHNFIPEFKQLTTNFSIKANTLFQELSDTNQFIESFLQPFQIKLINRKQISITELNTVPDFMWHRLFLNYGLTRKQNTEFIKFTQSKNGSLFKTTTFSFLKDRASIIISEKSKSKIECISINEELKVIKLQNVTLSFDKMNKSNSLEFKSSVAYLDYEKISFPLTLRSWKQGDKIQPLGMPGSKLVSDVLINKKINRFQKENQLVLVSEEKIVWIVGIMVSELFALQKKTQSILKITQLKY